MGREPIVRTSYDFLRKEFNQLRAHYTFCSVLSLRRSYFVHLCSYPTLHQVPLLGSTVRSPTSWDGLQKRHSQKNNLCIIRFCNPPVEVYHQPSTTSSSSSSSPIPCFDNLLCILLFAPSTTMCRTHVYGVVSIDAPQVHRATTIS